MKTAINLINATIFSPNGVCIPSQQIAIDEGKIVAILPMTEMSIHANETFDCKDNLVTPGLIDCHTHLVYAGDRAKEFELKLQGMSYEAITKAGGGVNSTVEKTRCASFDDLMAASLPRIKALIQEGVTTVEIKSGYGLNLASERKMLQVARALAKATGIRVKTTFLGAHTVPLEFKSRADAYMDYLVNEVLPILASEGLVDAVDVFCERIAFSVQQTTRLFECAQSLNLPIKCHAEQLSNMGASHLAASFQALSCDHLEHLDLAGVKALRDAGSVAVLLPGAFYFLKETQKPPVALLREQGVPIAIATDCNPGTSPTTSLLLMLNMACQLFGLTPTEALLGVTTNAALALGLQEVGQLLPQKIADIVVWGVSAPSLLCYHFGGSMVRNKTMIAGKWIN